MSVSPQNQFFKIPRRNEGKFSLHVLVISVVEFQASLNNFIIAFPALGRTLSLALRLAPPFLVHFADIAASHALRKGGGF